MKLVTFARDMKPYAAGDSLLVADDVAAAMSPDDVASSQPWPQEICADAIASLERRPDPSPAKAPQKPKRPVLTPTRPAGDLLDQRIAR